MRSIIRTDQDQSATGFRYRGKNSTRLEALTDTIFGFSITLLVVSLEVPKTYVELQASMYSFIGFIFCATLVLALWNRHYIYFLKYGLQDAFTKNLNFLLLFLLLYYVFPLKYLFNLLGILVWVKIKILFNDHSQALLLKIQELEAAALSTTQWSDLMINFGVGLFAIEFIYALWYWNAYRKREYLELNPLEVKETKMDLYAFVIKLGIPLLSILIILIFGGVSAGAAGSVYILIPLLLPVFYKIARKKITLV